MHKLITLCKKYAKSKLIELNGIFLQFRPKCPTLITDIHLLIIFLADTLPKLFKIDHKFPFPAQPTINMMVFIFEAISAIGANWIAIAPNSDTFWVEGVVAAREKESVGK
jgi:hypothetical protein